ncbi:glycerol-3-phosphate acyltransferase [Cohnella candidum]|uniref:Glycerol-3-phosphate acyltransferase n=1 Tax=Cohnella candidum TaxID=2674991 RepID=A0A3G3K3M6_9BACL|nr:glycerol-3-phosphate acyltransferase [Cohnella candidum]AYQ74980.1 glycerol-3-phosphate acyltransferase [Cohnella candidum]
MIEIALWTAVSFLSGSLMFSYWLGRLARHNLRDVGDGNPGALNLWRAAGYPYGLTGILLDFLKGFMPVAWLVHTGALTGYEMIPAAAAPIFGHAFSPFLRGRGGKAIAVTFGVWSALTAFRAALAYAVILAVLLLGARYLNKGKPTSSESDAFQVVLGMLLLSLYLYMDEFPREVWGFWLVNVLLLVYTHRRELRAVLKV